MNVTAKIEWTGRTAAVVALVVLLMSAGGCSKKSKIERYLHSGAEYVSKGDYLKAEIELLNAFRLDAGNLSAIRGLGEVYLQQGNFPKAYIFLKKAAESGKVDDDLRLKRARIFLALRRPKEAREESLAVLRNKPDSNEALVFLSQGATTTNELREVSAQLETLRAQAEKVPGFHLAVGTVALRQRNLKLAEESFSRALEMDPKMSMAHEMMAALQFRLRDVAKGGQHLKTAAELAPVRSLTPLRYVEFLRDTDNAAGALAKIEEIVKAAPDYLPASAYLAQIHFAANRLEQCAEITKRVLAMDPANYDALLLNGRLLLAKREMAKGMAELERLVRTFPGVPQAYFHLATAQLLNNEGLKAMASLNQAVALNPDYVEAVLLRAELGVRKGDAGEVINDMTDLLREHPQLMRAYIILGDAYGLRRNFGEALNTYGRMAQLFPTNPAPYYLAGNASVQLNRGAEARKFFEKARGLAPKYYPAFERLMELDIREKKFADALARVQPEIQQHPDLGALWMLQARVYEAATNLVQAEASVRKVMELDPKLVAAPLMLARVLTANGRAADALASMRQTLAKMPGDVSILMQVGLLESELGNKAGAREAYEQALKTDPNYGLALNNLACLYTDHFIDLDRAYELARKARELYPKDPVTGDTLGWVLYKRREYGYALTLLQQVSQALPDDPEVAYHLGMVQYMMGDEEGARASLTRATAGSSKYNGREEAAQRLQLLNLDLTKADAATLARMEKYLADNPGDPIVAGRLASMEEQKGNFEKALSIYERTIAANKGSVGAMSRAARIYAERLKNPKKALELAKAARDASPEDPALAHTLGAIAYATGEQAWAVNLLEESSRKLPDSADVLYDLALAQYSVGRVAEGEATMRRAIALGQAFPRLEAGKRWLTISSLYKDTARLRQSEPVLAEWLKAEPSNPAALMANASLQGLTNNRAGEEESYTRLVAIYPSFTPALIRLSSIYAGRADTLPKAFEMATKLRQALPNDPEVTRLMGMISYRRADYTRAAQLLNECSRSFKGDPEVWYYLGLAHHQLKQKEETRQALTQVLTLESTGSMASEARRVLAEIK